ncbi:MAG: hypothetical protein ACRDP6_49435 [Actinoallomurus sp.]
MENRLAVASDDAPLVLRRSPAVVAYVAVLGVLLLVSAALLAVQRSFYALPVMALAIVWTLRMGVVWARSRTEIGPEGILNHTVHTEVLIPWQEVVGVVPRPVTGTVVVVRRGGRATPLAGLRGWRSRKAPDLDQVLQTIEAWIEPPVDAPPRSVPPVIVRRLHLAPVRGLILVLTLAGVIAALLAVVHPVLTLATVFFLGLAAFLFAATKRALTEIGPDGIRNRALVRTVFVPWSEVSEVVVSETLSRTVRIVRPGRARMTLAALRDSDIPVDGLGLDDVADVIRERATAEPATATPLPRPRALSLRPSRRPLVWIVPLLVALVALVPLLDLAFPLIAIVVLPAAYLLHLASRLLWARTVAGPAGLRNRTGFKTTVISWSDIEEFVVVPTLFGRVVRVTRPPGRQFTLAAPREGLLGRDASLDSSVAIMRALAAVDERPPRVRTLPDGVRVVWWVALVLTLVLGTVVAKPWLEPWWPTRHEATSLPRACDLLRADNQLVTAPISRETNESDALSADSFCTRNGATGRIGLDLSLTHRWSGKSGTRLAKRQFTDARLGGDEDLRPVRLPGLGDEAWEGTHTVAHTTNVVLQVRRHNVKIQVNYDGDLPDWQAPALVEALVRTVLPHIHDGF